MIFILWNITKKQHNSVLLSFYMTQNKNRKTHISVDFPVWWTQGGSNPWPPDCEPGALPAELWAPILLFFSFWGHISVPHGLPAELWAQIICIYFITLYQFSQHFSRKGAPQNWDAPLIIYSSSGPVNAAIPVSPVRIRTTSSTS